MTTDNDEHFEVMKVEKSVLYNIRENHGDEAYKYALSIFKTIEENDALMKQKKEENDRFYGILQRLVMTRSAVEQRE